MSKPKEIVKFALTDAQMAELRKMVGGEPSCFLAQPDMRAGADYGTMTVRRFGRAEYNLLEAALAYIDRDKKGRAS